MESQNLKSTKDCSGRGQPSLGRPKSALTPGVPGTPGKRKGRVLQLQCEGGDEDLLCLNRKSKVFPEELTPDLLPVSFLQYLDCSQPWVRPPPPPQTPLQARMVT